MIHFEIDLNFYGEKWNLDRDGGQVGMMETLMEGWRMEVAQAKWTAMTKKGRRGRVD